MKFCETNTGRCRPTAPMQRRGSQTKLQQKHFHLNLQEDELHLPTKITWPNFGMKSACRGIIGKWNQDGLIGNACKIGWTPFFHKVENLKWTGKVQMDNGSWNKGKTLCHSTNFFKKLNFCGEQQLNKHLQGNLTRRNIAGKIDGTEYEMVRWRKCKILPCLPLTFLHFFHPLSYVGILSNSWDAFTGEEH